MGARIALAPALCIWAGTVTGLFTGAPVSPVLPILAVLAALAVVWCLRADAPRLAGAGLLLLFAFIGCALGACHAATISAQREFIATGGDLYRVEVCVTGPGARGGEYVEAEVRAARPPLLAGTRLRLRMPEGRRVGWGDRLVCLTHLEVASGRRNPGGFDGRAADFARGIAARGRVRAITLHDSSGSAVWTRATVVRWRRGIERLLDERLGETARAYATPLMVGDRTGMTPEQRARVRDAGLAHLLALSGLHVSWLAWLARGVVIAAGGGLVARALAGALSAIAYVGLAGPLPSLTRAAMTEVSGALARGTQRAFDPVQALSIAIIVLLAWRPGWALDLGFQLSCAATLGLVLSGDARGGSQARVGWRSRWLRPLRATAAAQLAATPLLLVHFHGLNWSVWIANLMAVPLTGLLLGLLWLAVIMETLLPGAGTPVFAACDLCARALDALTGACAALPFAFVPSGARAAVVALATAGAILLALDRLVSSRLLVPARRPVTERVRVLGWILALTAIVLALLPSSLRPPAGRIWIVALDVGQGDALALGMPDGWWLIDAGTRAPGYDAGESIVVPFFRWAGERSLDRLIITHLDADHAGGAKAVWRSLRPARVASPDSAAAALRPTRGRPLERFAAGDTLLAVPLLRVLWPPGDVQGGSRNDRSAVILLDAGGARALFTADADSLVERWLEVPPGALLLKVGHHGARSSSGASFLARLRPQEAVISAGRTNPFGHPHPETLARLAASGARVRRTDEEGAVWYELSADGIRDVDWRSGGWRARPDREPASLPSPSAPPRSR